MRFFGKMEFLIAAIFAAALVLRLFSFSWNYFPHGNVTENTRAAISIAKESSLKVASPSDEPYWYSTAKYGGRYLDLNAPLWPILAGVIAFLDRAPLNEAAMFALFKIMSLAAGMAVLFLAWRIARRLAGEDAGIFVLAVLAFSFLLVDYSANGSFYMAQALVYLLWVWVALFRPRFHVWLLGLLSGIGWLLSYQAMVMIAASVLFFLIQERPWADRLKTVGFLLITFVAVISPLLIRNYAVFGDPLHTTKINLTYVWAKAGLKPIVNGDVKSYEIGAREKLQALKGSLTDWLPHNLYYILRKLFVLLPALFIFFAFAALDYLFSGGLRSQPMLPVWLLLSLHFLQAATWPIVQFRYFVPALSLAALVGVEYVFRVFDRRLIWRNAALGVSFFLLVFTSYLMYQSNPLHVCYYDCAVTTGPLGRNEELEHLRANSILP